MVVDEAWVTYADAGYFGVLEVLLRSLQEFSTRKVLVYGVRSEFDARPHPNILEVHRADAPDHIWTLKMMIMNDAAPRAQRLIYLDADTIANHSIDEMWSLFEMQQQHPEWPLLPDHTDITRNPVALQYERVTGEHINRPFGCTTPIWYTAACVTVLAEAAVLKRAIERKLPGVGDSEVINATLAFHGSQMNAPFCTPFYQRFRDYLDQHIPVPSEMGEAPEVYYHVFHGCKDPVEAGQIFEALRGVRLPVHYVRTS